MSELSVDADCHRAPAGERGLHMGLQHLTDWMIVPATPGPVEDNYPADRLEAERQKEKRSPVVTNLEKQQHKRSLLQVHDQESLNH